jgi:hypothetical protein
MATFSIGMSDINRNKRNVWFVYSHKILHEKKMFSSEAPGNLVGGLTLEKGRCR